MAKKTNGMSALDLRGTTGTYAGRRRSAMRGEVEDDCFLSNEDRTPLTGPRCLTLGVTVHEASSHCPNQSLSRWSENGLFMNLARILTDHLDR